MLRRTPSGQGGGNDAAGPWEGRVLATVERPNISLRILVARAAVLVIAAMTLLALTGARPADAPAPPGNLDQLAQAPVDQPFQFPDTTGDEEDDSDTLDVAPSAEQQAPPPQSPAVEDTVGVFRPDLNPVPPGATADSTTAGAIADTTGARGAAPDTLFMPPAVLPTNPQPTTTTTTQPQGAPLPGPKLEAKKPRTGLFGIHPIAILVGLAALHIAVTHLAE